MQKQIEQWVSKVLYVSSEMEAFEAVHIIGPPSQFPCYGDFDTTWSPIAASTCESIEVEFDIAVFPRKIEIFETQNVGCCVKILAKGPNGWVVLYSGEPADNPQKQSQIFSPPLNSISFKTKQIRIEIDGRNSIDFYEIDAVRMTGTSFIENNEQLGYIPYNFHKNLNVTAEKPYFADLEVIIGGKSFWTHKCFLSQNKKFADLEKIEKLNIDDLPSATEIAYLLLHSYNYLDGHVTNEHLEFIFNILHSNGLVHFMSFLQNQENHGDFVELLTLHLANHVNCDNVLMFLSCIEETKRREMNFGIFQENRLRKKCLDFWIKHIRGRSSGIDTQLMYDQFEALDSDLKTELLTLVDPETVGDPIGFIDDSVEDSPQTVLETEPNLENETSDEIVEKCVEKIQDSAESHAVPQGNLSIHLESLLKGGKFSDFTLFCKDGKKIHVHCVVLASDSKFFRDLLFFEDHTEFEILDFDSTVVSRCLSWCYTRRVQRPDPSVLTSWIQFCEKYMFHDFLSLLKVEKQGDANNQHFKWVRRGLLQEKWFVSDTVVQWHMQVSKTFTCDRELSPGVFVAIKILGMSDPKVFQIGLSHDGKNIIGVNGIGEMIPKNVSNTAIIEAQRDPFKVGDEIGIIYDLERKMILFFVNRVFYHSVENSQSWGHLYVTLRSKSKADSYELIFPEEDPNVSWKSLYEKELEKQVDFDDLVISQLSLFSEDRDVNKSDELVQEDWEE